MCLFSLRRLAIPPGVAKLLREIATGDVLVVVRLDRLARSVSHLLEVIEQLEKRSVHFRSLRDPIDTSTPQGMFSLQVLGAVAQLERALIAARTNAGMKAAKARGRLAGNPGLPRRSAGSVRAIAAARERAYIDSCRLASSYCNVPRSDLLTINLTRSCRTITS
jgi:DNA invertase Pin-like site-specific DNA recombinase